VVFQYKGKELFMFNVLKQSDTTFHLGFIFFSVFGEKTEVVIVFLGYLTNINNSSRDLHS